MQVIARRTLKEFWARHPHAEGPIRAWLAIATTAHWTNPAEIKRQFGTTVDFVSDNRVIFDLGGNKYRLVVHVFLHSAACS
jgi:mRNA interferase HigB